MKYSLTALALATSLPTSRTAGLSLKAENQSHFSHIQNSSTNNASRYRSPISNQTMATARTNRRILNDHQGSLSLDGVWQPRPGASTFELASFGFTRGAHTAIQRIAGIAYNQSSPELRSAFYGNRPFTGASIAENFAFLAFLFVKYSKIETGLPALTADTVRAGATALLETLPNAENASSTIAALTSELWTQFTGVIPSEETVANTLKKFLTDYGLIEAAVNTFVSAVANIDDATAENIGNKFEKILAPSIDHTVDKSFYAGTHLIGWAVLGGLAFIAAGIPLACWCMAICTPLSRRALNMTESTLSRRDKVKSMTYNVATEIYNSFVENFTKPKSNNANNYQSLRPRRSRASLLRSHRRLSRTAPSRLQGIELTEQPPSSSSTRVINAQPNRANQDTAITLLMRAIADGARLAYEENKPKLLAELNSIFKGIGANFERKLDNVMNKVINSTLKQIQTQLPQAGQTSPILDRITQMFAENIRSAMLEEMSPDKLRAFQPTIDQFTSMFVQSLRRQMGRGPLSNFMFGPP